MKLVITSIKLKSVGQFFAFANHARLVLKQMKNHSVKGFKKGGFWKEHFTMSLWESEEDLKAFYTSGAHLNAVKKTNKMADEVYTLIMDGSEFPNWNEAKRLLKEKGRLKKY